MWVWEVFDVIGVGDMVIFILVVVFVVGEELLFVVGLVNLVVGIVVGKLGIVVISVFELCCVV